jgi:protein TonB
MPFKAGRLDFNRIFGYATAIAVHAVLFLLLLVPITAPPAITSPVVDTVWRPIERRVEVPPPPPPPVHAEVTHQTHAAPTRPVQPPQPPDNQQAVVNDAVVTNPVAASHVVDETTPVQPTGPIAGVQLEYAQAPAPTYPRDALRDAIEGTVMLRVLVDIDGRPLDVQVERSSGNRSLDRAAREQVLQHWRFRPATQNGRAVQAIGLVPVQFKLG